MSIKIQNIYYMLSYAFKILQEKRYESIGSEEFENTADLLAKILSKGITTQIKRGLGREYIPYCEDLTALRGKIELVPSINNKMRQIQKLTCTYDDFSINTPLNQILKTTVTILLKKEIKSSTKKELKNLMLFFKEVDALNPYTINWKIKFNRNNATYQMLINISYLILHDLLQKDSKGDIKLQQFLDEQKMHALYEKFILEYYKQHFPVLKPTSSSISWQTEEGNSYLEFLPKMQSDIVLTKKTETGIISLIIDAKFYSKSMQTNFDKKTLHSHNLYQIFTYVKNAESSSKFGKVSGMLLYAKTDEELTPHGIFNMSGNNIYIRNLDLNQNFSGIKEQLNKIAKDFTNT